MGEINGCLKRLFVTFNSIFLGIGILTIIGALKAGAYTNQLSTVDGPSMAWGWVFAIGIISMSSLGIYAGSSEKPLALKTFAGFMGIGMAIMMIFGFIVVDSRNKTRHGLLDTSNELTKHIMEAPESRKMLEQIQTAVHCCGLVSADDWGNDIPSSCACQYECKRKPKGTSGPDQIYQKTCGEFVYSSVSSMFEVAMGFCFVFAVIAFLGLLMSLVMIRQVKRGDSGCHA